MKKMINSEVWFWQRIVSPHMAHLAIDLAQRGYKVVYVAETSMSADRAAQGWSPPEMPNVVLHFAHNQREVTGLVLNAAENSIHICQGVRRNGIVGAAQRALARRSLRQWVVMETVKNSGILAFARRLIYTRIFSRKLPTLEGILATGYQTKAWLRDRGVPDGKIYPFAYFLPQLNGTLARVPPDKPFTFLFVGRLIQLKRLDWVLEALSQMVHSEFQLVIVGAGTQERILKKRAETLLPGRTTWLGQLVMDKIPNVMQQADCLVLPSAHDGWGAVVSEAMLVGTPVVCSSTCGAAGVVKMSGFGNVFDARSRSRLTEALRGELRKGRVTEKDRNALASWALCLSTKAGAQYLQNILNSANRADGVLPKTPWDAA